MKENPLKQQISEILVKWDVPTRQAMINEIVALLTLREQQIREEIAKVWKEVYFTSYHSGYSDYIKMSHEDFKKLERTIEIWG